MPLRAPLELSAWIFRAPQPATAGGSAAAQGVVAELRAESDSGTEPLLSLGETWSAAGRAGATVRFASGESFGKDAAPYVTRVGVWQHVSGAAGRMCCVGVVVGGFEE